jgi:1,4-alpha-glucan branching enzyme
VINVSDSQWSNANYAVFLGGEMGDWVEIFNSQAPVYGGIGTTGNFGSTISAADGYLHINLPSWSVLMFAKT